MGCTRSPENTGCLRTFRVKKLKKKEGTTFIVLFRLFLHERLAFEFSIPAQIICILTKINNLKLFILINIDYFTFIIFSNFSLLCVILSKYLRLHLWPQPCCDRSRNSRRWAAADRGTVYTWKSRIKLLW